MVTFFVEATGGVSVVVVDQIEPGAASCLFALLPSRFPLLIPPMKEKNSINPLIARIAKLFNEQLALENDYLHQENRILRGKLGKRVALAESERRILVTYGMRIKDRLGYIMSIARPETLLGWNRRMKQEKWTYDSTPKKRGRPNPTRAEPKRPVMETVHPIAYGCCMGVRSVHRGGLESERAGDLLRAVLHSSGEQTGLCRRVHAASGFGLDGATGTELLYGAG